MSMFESLNEKTEWQVGIYFFLFCPHWVYLLGRPAMYWGNGDKWLQEISNHRTNRANSKQHPLQSFSVSLPSQTLANMNHIWYTSTTKSKVYCVSAFSSFSEHKPQYTETHTFKQILEQPYLLWIKQHTMQIWHISLN